MSADAMTPSRPSQELERAKQCLRDCVRQQPRVGIVLGSGLGEFADTLAERVTVPYARIEGMLPTAVDGHAGNLVFGRCEGLPAVVMQGRLHLYEGHPVARVVFGVRLMVSLGARIIVLTNAAGGIRADLAPGSLMSIADHLNLTGHSPLIGPNDPLLGTRFPDMTAVYDPALRELAERAAGERGLTLASGTYAGLLGPSYETPAEIRMLSALGADAVGMSTVVEAIAVRHMQARCLGISCITNRAAGLGQRELAHREVQAVATQAREAFFALLHGTLAAIGSAA